jgi:hypothetical protein
MDETHVAKVVQARQRVETWSSTLLFDMSEAGNGSNIIDILCFVRYLSLPIMIQGRKAWRSFGVTSGKLHKNLGIKSV